MNNKSRINYLGARDVAHSVKSLLFKSMFKKSKGKKKQGLVMRVCNSSSGEAETEGSLASLASQPSLIVSSKPSERPCLKKYGRRELEKWLSG